MNQSNHSITDTINSFAQSVRRNHPALIFDDLDPEINPVTLTYEELNRSIDSYASTLQSKTSLQDRVLILLPPGIDYTISILACFRIGLIAVPAYPTKPGRPMERLDTIIRDCDPKVVLCASKNRPQFTTLCSQLSSGQKQILLLTEKELQSPDINESSKISIFPRHTAVLQYTSGSTGKAKGAIITHGNILANQDSICQAFKHSESTVMISWLPPYHDMGLIGGILQPLFVGGTAVLMNPASFLQDPKKWFRLITKYRGTSAGAPNFAYDLCARKIQDEELNELDLSSWSVAFNGAEPIRATTIDKFYEQFKRIGFRKESFLPCYGMAEATLLISGNKSTSPPNIINVSSTALEQHQLFIQERRSDHPTTQLVSCGEIAPGFEVVIVDPPTKSLSPPSRIGEVWVKGESVAKGYWRNFEVTNECFNQRPSDANSSDGFFRTGDYGVILKNELYITGRLKEILIVRGRNLYPNDLEASIENILYVKAGSIAAFEITATNTGSEGVGIIAEVDRKTPEDVYEDIKKQMQESIASNFDVQIDYIALIPASTLPKTSSGKIQRRAAGKKVMVGQLSSLYTWSKNSPTPKDAFVIVKEPNLNNLNVKENIQMKESQDHVNAILHWIRDDAPRKISLHLANERRALPPNAFLELGRLGCFGLEIPRSFGGLDLPMRDILKVVQHLGAFDVTMAAMVGIHTALGVRPVLRFAKDDHKSTLLPMFAQGRGLGSFALTEPGSGSNPRAMSAIAQQQKNAGVHIRGEKKYIGLAGWARSINVFAKHVNESGENLGITGYIVDSSQQGIRIGDEEMTMGVRAIVQNEVFFENCEVFPDCILGEIGQGFKVAEDAMSFGRLGLGAMCLGAMQRCLSLASDFVSVRQIATGRMIDNALVQDRLSSIHISAFCLDKLLEHIASNPDEKSEEYFMAAKVFGSESAWTAVDSCMQLMGGRGYTENNHIPRFFRDLRLIRIFEGPTEALLAYLGGKFLYNNSIRDSRIRASLQTDFEQITKVLNTNPNQKRILEHDCGWLVIYSILADVLQSDTALSNLRSHAIQWTRDKIVSLRTSLTTDQRGSKGNIFSGAELQNLARELSEKLGEYDTSYAPKERWASDFKHKLDTNVPGREIALPPPKVRIEQAAILKPKKEEPPPVAIPKTLPNLAPSVDLEKLLCIWLAKEANVDISKIDPTANISSLGLDSIVAIEAVAYLEKISKKTLPSDLLWSHPTIRAVIKAIMS